jgi:hypothetical protein
VKIKLNVRREKLFIINSIIKLLKKSILEECKRKKIEMRKKKNQFSRKSLKIASRVKKGKM